MAGQIIATVLGGAVSQKFKLEYGVLIGWWEFDDTDPLGK